MAHPVKPSGTPVKFTVPASSKSLAFGLLIAGFVTFSIALMRDPTRAWAGYLTAYFLFFSLGLGGLFFTAIQHVTNSAWSVTIRRLSEAMTAFIPWSALFAIVMVVAGSKNLYVWLQPDTVAADPLIQKKVAYLNQSFFYVRVVAFFALWLLFNKLIVSKSLEQDKTGDVNLTLRATKPSVIFLLVFAISYSLFSVDLLMSLDPHWFSTMFGVYCFAGLFQSSLAAIILLTLWLSRKGALQGYVNENHIHDLGKLLFAFTIFYAYIGFSQFMLIWYANIPEETEFFAHRAHGIWWTISLSLLVLKFAVPFLILLPRESKRNPNILGPASLLLLAMQYVDNYWLVYPNFNDGHAVFSIWELGALAGMAGAFMLAVFHFLGKNSIVAIKDPRLEESLSHHI